MNKPPKYWDRAKKILSKRDKVMKKLINDYKDGRNFPFKKNVSRLSPHLHHGEISPNTVW